MGDLHCGADSGLTPPAWISEKKQHFDLALRCWEFYETTLRLLQPIDVLIINGDLVEGKGRKNGGVELIETDLDRQAEMALDAIKIADAKTYVITRGTPYHVNSSDGSNLEYQISKLLKAEGADVHFGGHLFPEVNGHVFDVKHKIGQTSIPHGTSPLKRAWVSNALLAERGENPRADTIIRSHVHRFDYVGNARYLAMTLPALQTPFTRFGEDQCEGETDFGMASFDLNQNGQRKWLWHVIELVGKRDALKL